MSEPGIIDDTLVAMVATLELRYPYARGHSHRVASYAETFARRLGLSDDEVTRFRHGAVVHDIGKIGIPDGVLLKRSRLAPGEYALMQRHTLIGDRLCSHVHTLRHLRPIVRSHHERLDGTGYPDGLRHDAIPLLAQLMTIVDVFDALTTERPYRTAWAVDRAYDVLLEEAHRGWRRRDLVDLFIQAGVEHGWVG